ncbi:hypothetical protein [Puia sp.]|jgi:hypothetical protein|uniref:hypothetical protein n=1 Tax=Puia sp. TaxID=2045100 RepID=UPI002F408396
MTKKAGTHRIIRANDKSIIDYIYLIYYSESQTNYCFLPELISRLGAPPKLISLKIGNCDNRTLWDFLRQHIQKAFELLTTTDTDIVELE